MAIQQQMGMLSVERMALEVKLSKEVEPALTAENNKRTRKAKEDITQRLSAIGRQMQQLNKQLETDIAARVQKADEAVAVAKAKTKLAEKVAERRPKVNGKTIGCRDCTAEFLFGTNEQAFYTEKGLAEPTRCRDCRAHKKASRPQPQTLECYDCQVNFEFSVASQRFFEENGWEAPVRCTQCRKTHKAHKPLRINCDRCHKDFSFSVDAQKDFKDKGWEMPLRCRECRPLHKAEYAAKMAAEAEAASKAPTEAEAEPTKAPTDANAEPTKAPTDAQAE
jgi:hypothetical protein